MKPTPLSAVLADDLLLDRVGARLDTDDELGSLLLTVAHRVDAPIPRARLARRVRHHRGLTVLAALGVAVSGATVAAAVELAPMPADQASGAAHRSNLPPSLQALVLPFLSGTPFQGRLVLPFGGMPVVATSGTATVAGLPAIELAPTSPSGEPVTDATAAQKAQLDRQERADQQDVVRQKTLAKGTQAGAVAGEPSQTEEAVPGDETAAAPQPKPTTTPTQSTTVPNAGNGSTNGQATGIAGGQGNANGRGQGGSAGSTGSPGSTGTPTDGSGTGTTTGAIVEDDSDDHWSGAPAKGKHKITTGTTAGTTTGTTTTGTTASDSGGTASPIATSTVPTDTAATTTATAGRQ